MFRPPIGAASSAKRNPPPGDDLVERVAAILEVKLDDLFCEAGRLPPDLRGDIKAVVTLYRRNRDTAKASNRS